MTESAPVPAIYPAMLAVKKGIGTLEKKGVGPSSQGSYKFLQQDDIMEKLNELFQEHSVIVLPRLISHETTIREAEAAWSMGDVSKGIQPAPVRDGRLPSISVREWVEMEYCFTSTIDGSTLVATISGEAMDTQDKASRKAHTSAYKSALIIVFDIVTGDPSLDPDGSAPEDANRAVTTDRREGGTRGTQQLQAAATAGSAPGAARGRRAAAPNRSVTTDPAKAVRAADEPVEADPETGELPDPAEPPAPTALDIQKARVREAVAMLGIDAATVNAIAAEVTGKPDRAAWIVLPTAVKKLADELENRVKAKQGEGLDEFAGREPADVAGTE